jgi:DUF971 family protein
VTESTGTNNSTSTGSGSNGSGVVDVVSIEVARDSHVTISFGDGVTIRFELNELRLACPCAECDGRRQQGRDVAPALAAGQSVTVTAAELAGAFGLDLDWSDGHRTGIYGWVYLREAFDAGRLGTSA